jgi:hypothetical protein
MLHDDRHIRFDHTRIVRPAWNDLRVGEIVKANVPRAFGRYRDAIGTNRLSIRIEHGYLNLCVTIGHIKQACGLTTGELGLWPVAVGRDIAFCDRPARVPHSFHMSLAHRVLSVSSIIG